jgi:protein gp37
MAGSSDIEWTEATWNPIAGCTLVSPGCTNCYAQRMAARLQAMRVPKYEETTRQAGRRRVWTGRVNIDPNVIETPLKWKRPLRIFVNSMSDLFQDAVPDGTIVALWQTMRAAHWHTFQVLTKRPERMLEVLRAHHLDKLPNVWLGTSVESADYLHRVEILRRVPAYVRFVSFEPLLGPIVSPDLTDIDWAIIGGESGPGARAMPKQWVDDLRIACRDQHVSFFFKQWGGTRKKSAGRLLDGRTWDEYPAVNTAPLQI